MKCETCNLEHTATLCPRCGWDNTGDALSDGDKVERLVYSLENQPTGDLRAAVVAVRDTLGANAAADNNDWRWAVEALTAALTAAPPAPDTAEELAFAKWVRDSISTTQRLISMDDEGEVTIESNCDSCGYPASKCTCRTDAATPPAAAPCETCHDAKEIPCDDCDGLGHSGVTPGGGKPISCETCGGDEDDPGTGKVPCPTCTKPDVPPDPPGLGYDPDAPRRDFEREIYAQCDAEDAKAQVSPPRTAKPPAPAPGPSAGEPTDKRGLYQKYTVKRTDGRDALGERHHGCKYLVLDLTHDKYARIAAVYYAQRIINVNPTFSKELYDWATDIGLQAAMLAEGGEAK